jgi:bacillithiol biosynthesis deacetylase BshB1
MTKTGNEKVDVLAIAPHPDDLEIICGGTLAKLVKQGYRVAMVDLTTGEPTPRGTEEVRAREAEAARQVLGVPTRINLRLPNRELFDNLPNRYALATLFRKLTPGIVIGTAGRTPAASPDHYQAQLLIEAARFYSQLTKWDDRFGHTAPYRIPHLVYAPFPFDAEVRHYPGGFVVDITDTFEQKLESIRCYASQFDDTGYCISAGTRCGFNYGEPFTMPIPVGGPDLVSIVMGNKGSPAPVVLPGG